MVCSSRAGLSFERSVSIEAILEKSSAKLRPRSWERRAPGDSGAEDLAKDLKKKWVFFQPIWSAR